MAKDVWTFAGNVTSGRTSLVVREDTICDLESADIERRVDYQLQNRHCDHDIGARARQNMGVAHREHATSPVILGILSSGMAVALRAATPPSVEKAPEGDAMKRILFGVALASVLAAAPVTAAPRTQASIILNAPAQLSSLSASNVTAWPSLGDSVTFTVTYPDSLRSNFVYVQVICYQGPTHLLTYGATDVPDAEFLLGGTNSHWLANGGPASCVADLFYWSRGGKYTVMASTDFEVAG